MSNEGRPGPQFCVIVMDLFHYQDPEHELEVSGFATPEAARAYAEARVRDSVEEFRRPGISVRAQRAVVDVRRELPGAGQKLFRPGPARFLRRQSRDIRRTRLAGAGAATMKSVSTRFRQ